jgi:hypothetical protein
MAQKIPKKPHQNEGGSPRAYLVPLANKHVRDNITKEVGVALGDFLTACQPTMPQEEIDFISDHYKRVREIVAQEFVKNAG